MNSKSGSKDKPGLVRQKTMVDYSSRSKTPMSRSKTPPPRLHVEMPAASKDDNSARPISGKNAATTSCPVRNRPPAARSVEELSYMNPSRSAVKSSKDVLSKDDALALRYNAYLQSCLMIAHSKNVMKRKESKIVRQLEDLQSKLMDLDDKMSDLKVTSEKLELYKQIKEQLTKEIKNFEDLNNSVDISETNEQIKILENDLSILKLKNFHVPASAQTADEITRWLETINNDLKLLPGLERKMLPLTNLHSSLTKTKENIQQEELLKKECENKLKEAEELIVQNCYAKSLKKC